MNTSEVKYCYRCKRTTPLSNWNKNRRKKDGLSTECRQCNNERAKEWYFRGNNAARHKELLMTRRADNKTKLMTHFGGACLDCGGVFHDAVYDFHHLDPTQKDYGFGKINTCSWEKIEKEIIGKCVMLCSNCHRIRHALER